MCGQSEVSAPGLISTKLYEDLIARLILKPMTIWLHSEQHVSLAFLNRGFYVSHFHTHSKRGLNLIASTNNSSTF